METGATTVLHREPLGWQPFDRRVPFQLKRIGMTT
jgi:hypothetical protein